MVDIKYLASNRSCHGGSATARDTRISFVRVVATLAIVTCHLLQYHESDWAYVLNIGVPVFFAISGYLYGRKSLGDYLSFMSRAFIKIVIPSWIVSLFAILACCYFHHASVSAVEMMRSFLFIKPLPGLEHLWFVGYIVVCYAALPLLSAISTSAGGGSERRYWFVIVCVSVLYALLASRYKAFHTPAWVLSFSTTYFVARAEERYGVAALQYALRALVVLGAGAALLWALLYFAGVRGPIVGFSKPYFRAGIGLSLFAGLYLFLPSGRTNFLISILDYYSCEIYLVHHIVILGPLSLMPKGLFLVFVAVVAGSAALKVISRRVKMITESILI